MNSLVAGKARGLIQRAQRTKNIAGLSMNIKNDGNVWMHARSQFNLLLLRSTGEIGSYFKTFMPAPLTSNIHL